MKVVLHLSLPVTQNMLEKECLWHQKQKQMIVFYAQKRLEDHETGTLDKAVIQRINQSQMDAIALVEG